jgi:hypothetical protein
MCAQHDGHAVTDTSVGATDIVDPGWVIHSYCYVSDTFSRIKTIKGRGT